jgi:hypothetical protein
MTDNPADLCLLALMVASVAGAYIIYLITRAR